MNGVIGHLCAHIGLTGPKNLLRTVKWHCPQDTAYEIRGLAVWDRALPSVTEVPHDIESLQVSGEETFLKF